MNRQWILARRPDSSVSRDCFEYREVERAPRPAPGMVLVRYELLLCAPTIRNWISGNRNSYYPTVELGSVVMAPAIGTVIDSDRADCPVGTRLFGGGGWQDEEWIDPAAGFRVIPPDVSSVDAMGVLGINALTAYVGMLRIGDPKPGETLLVSGAAGSVGTVASQMGRIKGCRVIALAGGPDKVRWLQDDCRIPDVIDYKSENILERLDALCPDGFDIYFDNVGGPLLRDVVARMKQRGRIILCGQISTYDRGVDDLTPPLDMMRMIYGGIRMEGYLVRHHVDLIAPGLADLAAWSQQGLMAHREDVRAGFKELPETYALLFSGANKGTLLARIADEAGKPL